MAERVNQRVALTKRLLKESMIRILQKKTIRQVTVTELCQTAGINRSTFYAHYRIPSDVLSEIKRDFASSIAESTGHLARNEFGYDKLKCICQFIYDNREIQKILLANATDDEVMEAAMETSLNIWGPAKDTDYLKGVDMDSAVLVRAFYYHGIFYVIREWIIHDIHKTPAEVAALLYKILTSRADREAF